jgi:serine/threonine-protein kinase HipA
VASLSVKLGETPIGTITNLLGDYNVFAFEPAYAADPNRPILSQSFLDANEQLIAVVPRTHTVAPPFFSNLLPEAGSLLRAIVARQRRIKEARDYPFLAALGSDLPGAVIISEIEGDPGSPTEIAHPEADRELPLRFSLAGMQLKFSASMLGDRFSINDRSDGVPWIVKMPTNAYPRLPENEFAIMRFALAIGLDVPEIELRDLNAIVDLPRGMPGLREEERAVYAIRRFDRAADGSRIHGEDFNAIAGQAPNAKYENKTTAYVGSVISQLCGQDDVDEFVRRVIFGVIVGNDDMHLKNWSVRYLDGRHATIAPLYDFVCTRRYFPGGELALTIGGERRFDRITRETMRDFARQAQISQARVLKLVDDVCERVRSAWPEIRDSIADRELVATLERQFASVPLFRPGTARA